MAYRLLAAVLVGVPAASLPCAGMAQQDTQKEIERYRQLLAEGNPADLFEARGKSCRRRAARKPLARAVRSGSGSGRGEGRLCAAAALLPRYRPRRDLARIVTCMVTLQGFNPEDAMKKPVLGAGPPLRYGGARELRGRRVEGHEAGRAAAPPQGDRGFPDRRAALLPPRRAARFFLRQLPRRERQAHPAPGIAQAHRSPRRAKDLHHLAGVPRFAGICPHHAAPALR